MCSVHLLHYLTYYRCAHAIVAFAWCFESLASSPQCCPCWGLQYLLMVLFYLFDTSLQSCTGSGVWLPFTWHTMQPFSQKEPSPHLLSRLSGMIFTVFVITIINIFTDIFPWWVIFLNILFWVFSVSEHQLVMLSECASLWSRSDSSEHLIIINSFRFIYLFILQ